MCLLLPVVSGSSKYCHLNVFIYLLITILNHLFQRRQSRPKLVPATDPPSPINGADVKDLDGIASANLKSTH